MSDLPKHDSADKRRQHDRDARFAMRFRCRGRAHAGRKDDGLPLYGLVSHLF